MEIGLLCRFECDQKKADVGWMTIDNNNGKRYLDAKLKLVAGDINTVGNQGVRPQLADNTTFAAPADSFPSFSMKSFSEFHM